MIFDITKIANFGCNFRKRHMIDTIKNLFSAKKRTGNTERATCRHDAGTFRFSQVNTAGVLFNNQNIRSRALLKGFLRAVKPMGIKLAVVGYDKPGSGKLPALNIPFLAYTSKDFGFFGSIKQGVLTNFTSKRFDMLIDLSLSDNRKARAVTRASAATFKIGVNIPDDVFDLSFSMPATEEENPDAFAELLEHLKKINANY